MNKLASLLAAAALISVSTMAQAGGPVQATTEPSPIVVTEGSASSPSLVGSGAGGVAIGALVIAAVVFGTSESSGSHGSSFSD